MKKWHRTVFQNAWSQKITHSHGIKKLLLLQKSLQVHMKKGHRTVFQNPWSQKNQHSHWKNNSVSKKLTNSYEKRTQNRLPKCLNPKKTTLSLKKQFCFKKAYKFIWKNATEPFSKMPEAKKTTLSLKKTILFQKSLQIHMKKCHRTVFQNAWSQKNQHSHWKKQFCFKTAYKLIWKKATEPFSKMPEAKKINTLIEKTSLLQKSLQIHMKKMTHDRLPKCLNPKKTTLSLKKQFCFKKAYKFIWKNGTEPFSKMPEAKKTNTLIEKNNSVSKKLTTSYEKMTQERFPKCLKPKRPTLSLKNNSA